MNLSSPGTRAHAPEVKIESNSRSDIVQGGEEMMEPENDVAPPPPVVPVAPTNDRVTPDGQAVRRSTRVPKPSMRYPAEEFDTS